MPHHTFGAREDIAFVLLLHWHIYIPNLATLSQLWRKITGSAKKAKMLKGRYFVLHWHRGYLYKFGDPK